MSRYVFIAEKDLKRSAAFQQLLTEQSFEVSTTDNGKDAYKSLNLGQAPAAVLIHADIGEMSALDVCRQLKKEPRYKQTVVGVIHPPDKDIKPYRDIGVNEFFREDVPATAFVEAMTKIVRHGSSSYVPPKASFWKRYGHYITATLVFGLLGAIIYSVFIRPGFR